VSFSALTTATDNVDGDVPVVCSPASGSLFAIDATTSHRTTVNCSATDKSLNTQPGSFIVEVVDTTPPAVTVPATQSVSATGVSTIVAFTATPSASDLVDGAGVPVMCSRASGSPFPVRATTVSGPAADEHG